MKHPLCLLLLLTCCSLHSQSDQLKYLDWELSLAGNSSLVSGNLESRRGFALSFNRTWNNESAVRASLGLLYCYSSLYAPFISVDRHSSYYDMSLYQHFVAFPFSVRVGSRGKVRPFAEISVAPGLLLVTGNGSESTFMPGSSGYTRKTQPLLGLNPNILFSGGAGVIFPVASLRFTTGLFLADNLSHLLDDNEQNIYTWQRLVNLRVGVQLHLGQLRGAP